MENQKKNELFDKWIMRHNKMSKQNYEAVKLATSGEYLDQMQKAFEAGQTKGHDICPDCVLKVFAEIDLHGKLEGIIHISNKEIRYQMFSKYEKELAKKFDEAKA